MPDFGIYAGDTNKTIYVRLRDSSTGLAKTGLAYNSAGAVLSYTLPLAARAAITLATQTVTGAHSDGGFVEIDATNCKGLYRVDLSDAAIASGDYTIISIEFDGIIEESVEIPLHTRKVNAIEVGGTTLTARDLGASVLLSSGSGTGQVALTSGKVDGVALVDTTTAVTNEVTADATKWAGTATTISSTTAKPEVDAFSISDDDTSANALELQYDGTGLTGDTYPATQAGLGNIASGSAAISTTAILSPNGFVITTGTSEGNNEDSTAQEDGTFHTLAPSGGTTDAYYIFDVGGNGVPVSCTWVGYAQGNGDSYGVYGWNWAGTSWEQIGTITAANGTTLQNHDYGFTSAHVGTGSDIGKVRFRFQSADASLFATDRILCNYAVVSQSVGYDGGQVWIDTGHGTSGTENYVNGVADNPSDTLADALTIASSLNLHKLHASRDTVLAPVADFNNYTVQGAGYTFTLGGHDYAGTHIYHCSPLTGTATSTGNADHFDVIDAIIGDVTVDDVHFTRCGFAGTITLSGTGTSSPSGCKFIDCHSLIAGSSTPVLDFGTGSEDHSVTFANWQNGIEIRNFNKTTTGGTDLLSLSGTGQIVIASTCDGGQVNLRGQWKVTDNSGGAVTIVQDDVSTSVAAIEVDTTEIGTAGIGLTEAGGDGDQLTAIPGSSDPWDTALPGAYGAGTAGKIVGDNIDAVISAIPTTMVGTDNAATEAKQDIIDTNVDTILVDTGTTIPGTITTMQTDVTQIKGDLPVKLTKNVAFTNFMFKLVNETDGFTAETGITPVETRSLDGAAFSACANNATEVSGGWYKIDLDAADLNGNSVVLRFTGTGCRATEFVVVTQAT